MEAGQRINSGRNRLDDTDSFSREDNSGVGRDGHIVFNERHTLRAEGLYGCYD